MWHIIGAVAAGLVVGAALVVVLNKFWDDIAYWLNNTAAEVVGRRLGFNAKRNMQRAVVKIGRTRDILRNAATILTKRNPMDSYYTKVTYETEASVYQVDEGILEAIEEKGELVNEFRYDN